MKKTTAKKSPLKKEKEKAWKIFSEYIRLRDCLKTTKTILGGECYTCRRIKHYKELQAGHFLPGRHNANLFDERGCHAQCWWCNIQLYGNIPSYYKRMLADYGQEVIDQLLEQNQEIKPMKINDFIAKHEEFKVKIELLKKQY